MTLAERLETKSALLQRCIALLILAALLACGWVLSAFPLKWLLTSQSDWRESVQVQLARARREAAALKTLTDRSVAFPSAAIWQRMYGKSASRGAGDAIQQDLTRLCASAGMQAQSVALLASEKEGALIRHTVRVSMTGRADVFQSLLTQLRTNPVYLRVEKLTVTSPVESARR